MRIIEQQMLEAISLRRNWRRSNTRVEIVANGTLAAVYLHENLIALVHLHASVLYLSSAGWRTRTTKSRLNALLDRYNRSIYQCHGVWYWDTGMVFTDAPLQSILLDYERPTTRSDRKRDKNLFVA